MRPKLAALLLVLALLLATSSIGQTSASRPAARRPVVREVQTVGFTVSDMNRSIEFFSKVLFFEKVSDVEVAGDEYERLQGVFGLRMRVVRMRLGDESIELTEYLAPRGRAIPPDSQSNDQWFQHIAIITNDMDRAYQWLREHRVTHASSSPQRLPDWNKSARGIKAFYFKDPDGHGLEILQFPDGKGDDKWHQLAKQNPGRMFLGVDHTAIVVINTERSLAFYRDVLGMRVAGESENYGVEQERLNNVLGAHLRITAVRAERGPGIEFLEYLAPSTGRLTPRDTRSNDIVHWQTKLVTTEIDEIEMLLRRQKVEFVSPGVIGLRETPFGLTRSFLVRDPDAHTIQLIQKNSNRTKQEIEQ